MLNFPVNFAHLTPFSCAYRLRLKRDTQLQWGDIREKEKERERGETTEKCS